MPVLRRYADDEKGPDGLPNSPHLGANCQATVRLLDEAVAEACWEPLWAGTSGVIITYFPAMMPAEVIRTQYDAS
jgi:hypothetical protein